MASTVLTRTPSGGNYKTATFSAWVKKAENDREQVLLSFRNNSDDYQFSCKFRSGNFLRWEDYASVTTMRLESNAKFRDVNGWYHVVANVDTTQATDTNRAKLWVNGEEISLQTATYPSQNTNLQINGNIGGTNSQQLGAYSTSAFLPLNGIMSHVHWIDGTAYDPTAFGEYDANGVWKIKTSPSVTYGTNGFFILKNGNSVTDQSPNTNNFTVAGGTLTNTEDSPSNVFATLNPLDNDNLQSGFSNGNTTVSGASSESRKYYCSLNLGMMGDGKYYFESKLNVNNQGVLGVCNLDVSDNPTYLRQQNTFVGTYSGSFGYDLTDGGYFNNNTKTSYGGTSWTANDIISFALDNTNKKMYIAKNGSWVNSGNPSAGTGGIDYSSLGDNNMFIVGDNNAAGYNSFSFNFGNGYFGTTAVSSAGTNASGIGIFEYDVPTGYTALSTKGLNL
jgi:hypothetical protein